MKSVKLNEAVLRVEELEERATPDVLVNIAGGTSGFTSISGASSGNVSSEDGNAESLASSASAAGFGNTALGSSGDMSAVLSESHDNLYSLIVNSEVNS
jgi:hypothetical protein